MKCDNDCGGGSTADDVDRSQDKEVVQATQVSSVVVAQLMMFGLD